ncbi:hypothetical protein JQX13_17075 [Archangium violaceum]|uniref:hypothetical protein n=1 Tax=Archangium violaceum TaxID=83451 RepID=UPI00193BEF1E|nr:hypothetical protein [Archangium violaceum]QRK11628.1 hypothetical protein JQX13_17075 [Archangium violaceum]
MLSIHFDAEREWWVSGRIFERLFQSALDSGKMPSKLEQWLHVADANGGLDLSLLDPSEASELVTVLRDAALRDLAKLGDVDAESEDGAYRDSLLKMLKVSQIG